VKKQYNWNQPSNIRTNFKIRHHRITSAGGTQALEDHIDYKKLKLQ